jgi:phenylalanyl-tRNA synthetase beta chain
MKFSIAHLRSWIGIDWDNQALCDRLSLAGLEVDSLDDVAAPFSNVCVGEITEATRHPDADRLQCCKVNVGTPAPLSIVCGAKNARVGLKVAVAQVGAVLGADFVIKKTELRGQLSEGMLCSLKELGMADASDGILELPTDSVVGQDVHDTLELNDQVIDVDLTANRGDCASISGIAQEVSALSGNTITCPTINAPKATGACDVKLDVQDIKNCPVYLGCVVSNINTAAQTPLWLAERLRRAGLSQVSLVVDITNYVMLELGQPMHAFDRAHLKGVVTVRQSVAGETLELLEGNAATLEAGTLLICDDSTPIAIAGIMGGTSTAINGKSETIFLESAHFAPLAIMGKARRYGLQTDASYRFERGVSPDVCEQALHYACALLVKYAGASVSETVSAVSKQDVPQARTVSVTLTDINGLLGTAFTQEQVTQTFTCLGFDVVQRKGEFAVTVPARRFDIAIKEDLIEEVARIIGYENIAPVLPALPVRPTMASEASASLLSAKQAMVARGFHEAVTYSFLDPKHQAVFFPDAETLTLQNPIGADLSQMRLSLLPGLVSALGHNIKRQNMRVRLFETGACFVEGEEPQRVAAVAVGLVSPEGWDKNQNADFYSVKSDLEALFGPHASELVYSTENLPAYMHPGQSAVLSFDGEVLGVMGALHPAVLKASGVKAKVFAFELDLDAVLARGHTQYQTVPKFPSVRRDLALEVGCAQTSADIQSAIENSGVETLVDVFLFDQYQSEHLEKGKKSLAFALIFQDSSCTLTEALVNQSVEKIELALDKVNVKIREG